MQSWIAISSEHEDIARTSSSESEVPTLLSRLNAPTPSELVRKRRMSKVLLDTATEPEVQSCYRVHFYFKER